MRHRTLMSALAALAAGLAASAWAGGSQNMGGCGWGSQLFKDSDTGSQILAATTNGTFYNQFFGITFGTAGCNSSPGFARRQERERFVAANYRSLSRELAAGEGEYATAFASVLGCGKESVPAFLSFAKSRYGEIFPAEGATPIGSLDAVEAAIAKDPGLTKACSL